MGLILKDRDGNPNALSKLIDEIVLRSSRTKPRKDTVCAATGYNGVGKSTFVWEMCKEISKREMELGLISEAWDPVQDGIWKPEKQEMKSKIYAKKFTPMLFDEMLSVSNKHNWGTGIALYAEAIFLVNRTQQRPFFLVGTRLGGFAENFRNQRVLLNFLILETGKGVVLRRHPDPNVSDPWFLKDLEKDVTEMGKDRGDAEDFLFGGNRIPFYKARINYVCPFYFTELSANDQAVYDKLRDRLTSESIALDGARTIKEKSALNETRLVNTAQNLLLAGKDVKEIAAIMGTNTIAVNNLLKKSVLDIKPAPTPPTPTTPIAPVG